MNGLTWILYLVGSLLVLGSWFGLVDSTLAWVGWGVATAIALGAWCNWFQRSPTPRTHTSDDDYVPPPPFTAEEEAAARREMDGEEIP